MSNSKIVKAPFVAMSDIRREIKTIDPKDPKIIRNIHEQSEDINEESIGIENLEVEQIEAVGEEEDYADGSNNISIEEVKEEIEKMLQDAQVEAETIREMARQEGYDAGYTEGQEQGKQMMDETISSLELERKQMVDDWEEEKEQFYRQMEPKIADIISELVQRLVGRYEEPSIIIYLIRLAFEELHVHGNLVIKVSTEDYDYLLTNKDEITKGLSEKVEIELIKDSSMEKNQCYIESDLGNVDCSLDVRLDHLKRELKLIGESLK